MPSAETEGARQHDGAGKVNAVDIVTAPTGPQRALRDAGSSSSSPNETLRKTGGV